MDFLGHEQRTLLAIRRVSRSTDSPARPGILKVFWPAFLAWGTVATVAALFEWYSSAPHVVGYYWFWDIFFEWGPESVYTLVWLSAAGAVFVTVRYREARHWLPISINLTTAFVLWLILTPRPAH